MNDLDLSPVLDQLDAKAQDLLSLSSSSLEQQSVATLLKVVAQVDAIAQVCEQTRDRLLSLASEALPEPLSTELHHSQSQLEQIIQQCRGEATPSASLKKVRSDLNQWRLHFSTLIKQLNEIKHRRTMQAECLRLYQETKTFQNRALLLRLDSERKLDLLKQLLDLEQGLTIVQQHLDVSDRTGLQEQQRLDSFKRAIADLGSTYGLLTVKS